jgi:hypothetical protein
MPLQGAEVAGSLKQRAAGRSSFRCDTVVDGDDELTEALAGSHAAIAARESTRPRRAPLESVGQAEDAPGGERDVDEPIGAEHVLDALDEPRQLARTSS